MSSQINLEVQVSDAALQSLVQRLQQTNAAAQQTQQTISNLGGNSRQVTNYTNSLQKLLDKLDPVGKSARQTQDNINLLNSALSDGLITADAHAAAMSKVSDATDKVGHSASGARREYIVLAHELASGNFSRFGGSLMVLAEQFDALKLLMSPVGAAIGIVAGAIAISGVAAVHAAESLAKYGEEVTKLSQSSGASTDMIQTLNYALERTGGSTKSGTSAIDELSKKLGDAKGGSKEAIGQFQAVGVSLSDIKNLSFDDVLGKIADKFSTTADDAGKYTAAQQLFGEGAKDLIPVLDQGSTGLANLKQEASDAGAVLGGETLNKTKQLADQMNQLSANSAAAALTAKTELLPTLINVTGAMVELQGKGDLLKDFFSGIGTVIKGVVSVVGTLAVGFQQVSEVIASTATVVGLAATGEFRLAGIAAENGYQHLKDQGNDYKSFMTKLWSDSTSQPTEKSGPAGKVTGSITPHVGGTGSQPKSNENELNGELKAQENAIKDADNQMKTSLENEKTILDQRLETQEDYFNHVHQIQSDALTKELAIAQQAEEIAKQKKSIAAQEEYAQKVKDIQAKLAQNDAQYQANLAKLHDQEAQSWQKITESIANYERAADKASAKTVSRIGMGSQQASDQDRLDGVANQFQTERNSLYNSRNSDPKSRDTDEYKQKLEELNEAEAKATQDELGRIQKEKEARADWKNGMSSAFDDYISKAQDVASQTKSAFTDAFQGLEDSLVNFVTTGKLSFTSLAQSIIADITRMIIKALEAKALGVLFSSVGLGSAAGAGTAAAGASSGVSSAGAMFAAKGAAFSGGNHLTAFAQGTIVSSPTTFGMNSGTGLMGEAGPEAILPLTRTSDGKLGVSTGGSSSSSSDGGDSYQINVYVTGGTTNEQTGSVVSQAVLTQMRGIAKDEIQKSNRPGGISNSMALGNSK